MSDPGSACASSSSRSPGTSRGLGADRHPGPGSGAVTLSSGDSRVVQGRRRRGRVEDVLTARGLQYVLAILLALVIGGGAPTPTDTPITPGLTTGSPSRVLRHYATTPPRCHFGARLPVPRGRDHHRRPGRGRRRRLTGLLVSPPEAGILGPAVREAPQGSSSNSGTCVGRPTEKWRWSNVVSRVIPRRSAAAMTEPSKVPSGRSRYRATSSAIRSQSPSVTGSTMRLS